MTKFLIEYWPDFAHSTSVKKPDGTMWVVEAESPSDAVTVALLSWDSPRGARIRKAWALADDGSADPEKLTVQP